MARMHDNLRRQQRQQQPGRRSGGLPSVVVRAAQVP